MTPRRAAFESEHFLELAKILVTDSNYEVESRTRTAIGRAYYAAFLATRKKLQELGYSLREKYRIHDQVIEFAKGENTTLGNWLGTLFDERVEADYEEHPYIRLETGEKCLKISSRIFKLLAGLQG